MGLLRLLLALSVIANHCGSFINNDLVGGKIAVQAFYIISGFYMSLVLNEKYVNKNSSYRLFVSNRLMKLMPLYWVVLLMVFVGSWIITSYYSYDAFYFNLANYKTESVDNLSYPFLILSNILVFGQDVLMFMGLDSSGSLFFTEDFRKADFAAYHFLLVPQGWSLAVEITFYLVAPFILKKGIRLVLFVLLSSLALRLFLFNFMDFNYDPWTYRFFPTELMFFLLGYISYRLYKRIQIYQMSNMQGYAILIGLIFLTVGFYKIPYIGIPFFPFSGNEVFYFTALTLCIPFIFNLTKTYKLDRILGDLSYPIYIIHYFVYCVLMTLFQWGYIGDYLKSSFTVAVFSIVLSYLLNKLVMDKLEVKRQSRLR